MKVDWKQRPSASWIAELRDRFPTERTVDDVLTNKLLRRSDPPYCGLSKDSVTGLLQTYLRPRVGSDFEISDVNYLSGGASKDQFSFKLRTGSATPLHLVLRAQPSESVVETHRLREFQILAAMVGEMPVPEVFWVDADGSEFGCPCLIYSFVSGIARPPAAGPISNHWSLWPQEIRSAIGPQFLQYFGRLASFDYEGKDLSAFDIPEAGTIEAPIQAINWFERVWEEDSLEFSPIMTLAASWLRENAPIADRISVIHGDFRPGNFLFHPTRLTITSILDWELVRFGDFHEDLAFTAMPLFRQSDEQGRELLAGFYTADDFFSRYEAASGFVIDPKKLAYYRVFHYWRNAVLACATAQRCALGAKTKQDLSLVCSASIGFMLLDRLQHELRQYL